MASTTRRLSKILLKDLNSVLTCTLCGGYFIDATTLVDCFHVFCKGCILKHYESTKQGCPLCNKRKQGGFRPDPQMQALVYKMVPGLYQKEMQRRDDFFRSTVIRASSSCSDDSVLGDLKQDLEKRTTKNLDLSSHFFSPEDSISLSLEYYQHHLDETSTESTKKSSESEQSDNNNKSDLNLIKSVDKGEKVHDRRYLQCPAGVSMSHLQKFLRMKFALSPEHKVDIIYEGEVLPSYFNLMDVAYTFNWSKKKPMRFFYRIFTPMKIQPIKIINTSSSGTKQLQIVPIKPTNETKPPIPETSEKEMIDNENRNDKNKERLMAHLKLQSKHKIIEDVNKKTTPEPNCIYEYEEPDKEEIKRFAENRDREWARMHQEEPETHHVSKKRKKNKHSRNELKKRKIHAEITSEVKDESIKLKVKLHNGHKHKHRLPQIVENKVENKKEDKKIKIEENKIEEVKMRGDFTIKPLHSTEGDKQAQQTFLKTFQSHPERFPNLTEKIVTNKIEKDKKPINTYSNPNHQNQIKSLERKIASLQQQCTIETKNKEQPKKINFNNEKPHILNTHLQPSGFTVSKIDGVKRKSEEEGLPEKRPSLEITLISPEQPVKPKRPPPATIPLERIKKSMKSIIKPNDNAPLDLSKPHKIEPKPNGVTTLNGIKDLKSLNLKPPDNTNLQMLSKVASEHPLLNKPNNNNNNNIKPRPQIPNLQTLKIPAPQSIKTPSPVPKLHKLDDINKTFIRLLNNSQIRNMRPSQNQSVRNIPNPSLLVRQQNQNRLLNNLQNGEKEPKILNSLAKENGKEEKKVVENGTST